MTLGFQLLLESFGEPDSCEGHGIGRALAGRPTQDRFHGGRKAHVELRCVILKESLLQDPVKVAMVFY